MDSLMEILFEFQFDKCAIWLNMKIITTLLLNIKIWMID